MEKKLDSLRDNNLKYIKTKSHNGSNCNVSTRKPKESEYVTSSFSRHLNNNKSNYMKLNHTLNFERNHRIAVDKAHYVAKHQRISDTLRKKIDPYPRICLENSSGVDKFEKKVQVLGSEASSTSQSSSQALSSTSKASLKGSSLIPITLKGVKFSK